MPTDERLAEIAERVEKAAPEPWYVNASTDTFGWINYSVFGYEHADNYKEVNRDFIQNAREDIPYLLSLIDSLSRRAGEAEKENEGLRGALKFYADDDGILWEPCEDDQQPRGLFRQYITGTCHPREIARCALLRGKE